MSIKELKSMKDQLMTCVQAQMNDLKQTNTHQLGQAIDMIKDLSQAIYYCTITESMEKVDENQNVRTNINYYTLPDREDPEYWRTRDRRRGYMYYVGDTPDTWNKPTTAGTMQAAVDGNRTYYTEMPYEIWHDPREGRSPMRRRMYMEGKEKHNDPKTQLQELETYMQELSTDITEMIQNASPEEKNSLRQRMLTLANKIV